MEQKKKLEVQEEYQREEEVWRCIVKVNKFWRCSLKVQTLIAVTLINYPQQPS